MDAPIGLKVLSYYGLITSRIGDVTSTRNVKILCPFHNEKHASLSFDIKTGLYLCFSCGARGRDVVQFIEHYENTHGNPWTDGRLIDELLASKLKAHIAALPLETQMSLFVDPYADLDYFEKRRLAWEFFDSLPRPQWDLILHHYLLDIRKFSSETLSYFDVRLNVTSSYPIVIPLYEQGKFRGYVQRRIIEGDPKYLYNDGMRKRTILEGRLQKGPLLITEGKTDQMMALQYGWENTGCTLGWHCSETQWKKIKQYATEIICAYHNDDRGRQGFDLMVGFARKDGVPIRRFIYPENANDICDLSANEFRYAMYLG